MEVAAGRTPTRPPPRREEGIVSPSLFHHLMRIPASASRVWPPIRPRLRISGTDRPRVFTRGGKSPVTRKVRCCGTGVPIPQRWMDARRGETFGRSRAGRPSACPHAAGMSASCPSILHEQSSRVRQRGVSGRIGAPDDRRHAAGVLNQPARHGPPSTPQVEISSSERETIRDWSVAIRRERECATSGNPLYIAPDPAKRRKHPNANAVITCGRIT